MNWRTRIADLSGRIFRRKRLDNELDEELRCHFDLLVDRYIERGLEPEAARRAALAEFQGVELVHGPLQRYLFGEVFGGLSHDFRQAWRSLLQSRGFTTVALTTLALGVGVNTAVFSVFYAVLLKPLPFEQPDRLVMVWSNFQKTAGQHTPTSGPMLGELERRSRTLQDVSGNWVTTGTFTGDENPEQVYVALVTPSFFRTLGCRMAMGRGFAQEESFGGRPAIVLTDGLWRRRFGADPNIVGKSVRFRGDDPIVIGVLPPSFRIFFSPDSIVTADVQAFIPFPDNIYRDPPTLYYLRVLARLKPATSLARAQEDLNRVAREIRGVYGDLEEEKLTFTVAKTQADAVRDIGPAVLAVFGGAAFVLLICCANVTNLLLARSSYRRREVAVRLALGASRIRIIRQLLIEGFVLCAPASCAGVAVGWAALRMLIAIAPDRLTRTGAIGLNWPVLLFATLVSTAAVLLFGLVPGVEWLRFDLMGTIRQTPGAAHRSLGHRLGAALIVAEITIGFVLVAGGGLLARSLRNLESVRPGFEARKLLTFQVALSPWLYAGNQLTRERDWEARLAALPGVEALGATSHLPLADAGNWYGPFRGEGVTRVDAATNLADYRSVTSGYLEAMGVHLLEGRYFDRRDRADSSSVVIVDELVAHAAWPGQTALGKRIEVEHLTADGFVPMWSEVVGVAEHVLNHSLAKRLRGEIYMPYEQSPRSPLSYVLRTKEDPLSLASAIRRELRALDPHLALSNVRPMESYVRRDLAPAAFTATLAEIFAGLALLLAAVGIFGLFHYQVSRRIREMGIRIALGANRRNVIGLVMREGMTLTMIGLLLGFMGAAAGSRWLASLMYGVSSVDPLAYSIALLLLIAAAALGCLGPALRAAGANPVDAIRAE